MKATQILSIIIAAMLLLASCNKGGGESSDGGGNGANVSDSADSSSTGDSAGLPDSDADVDENPGEGSEQDGAASARRIPDFNVRHPDGTVSPISEFYGKPLVVNFWGDWCEPCLVELPDMDAVYRERAGEFDMIAVSVDSEAAMDYWAEKGFEIPMYFDVDGRQQLGLTAMPSTFFLEADGSVAGFTAGAMSREDFETRLATILK